MVHSLSYNANYSNMLKMYGEIAVDEEDMSGGMLKCKPKYDMDNRNLKAFRAHKAAHLALGANVIFKRAVSRMAAPLPPVQSCSRPLRTHPSGGRSARRRRQQQQQ
jgi:hypothetical protein